VGQFHCIFLENGKYVYCFASVKILLTSFLYNVLAPASFGTGSWNLAGGMEICGKDINLKTNSAMSGKFVCMQG